MGVEAGVDDGGGEQDHDGDGLLDCADCADGNSGNFPGNDEACDGADNDCDGLVDEDFAEKLISNQFVEVIIAPNYDAEALEVFKQKNNIRVLSVEGYKKNRIDFQIQSIDGGFLVQEDDDKIITKDDLNCVTEKKPNQDEIQDLIFAWQVAKYVKSNAIVFAKHRQTIGIGAGQMSRVNSAKIASLKAASAKLDTTGAVMSSDGFFPFRDSIDMIADSGIEAVIQPGGSVRDEEVVDACNDHGISMVFTGQRCFKH